MQFFSLFLVLVTSFSAVFAQTRIDSLSKPEQIRYWKDKATREFNSLQYKSAVQSYTKLLGLSPGQDAFYRRGYSYSKLREYPKAITDLNKAISLGPKTVTAQYAYLRRGCVRYIQKNYTGAIADLEQARKTLKAFEEDKEANQFLAYAYYQQRNYSKALLFLEQYLMLNAGSPLAQDHWWLANCQMYAGKHEFALEHYTTALSIDPENAELYNSRAIALEFCGRYPEAISNYETALDKKYADAGRNLYQLYLDLSMPDQAVYALTRTIELAPADAQLYFFRGMLKKDLYDIEGYRSDLDKALELKPKYREALMERADFAFSMGNKSQACSDWSKAGELGTKLAYEKLKLYCR